jgi:benzoyl-CoA reductase/2-hydroxyglutaryl-CoA dehydratase subunit BcrC/BadD/HgdB
MPPAIAKKMFENIKRGVAVVVYELPGTETYDKNKDKNKTTKTQKAAEKTTEDTVEN